MSTWKNEYCSNCKYVVNNVCRHSPPVVHENVFQYPIVIRRFTSVSKIDWTAQACSKFLRKKAND